MSVKEELIDWLNSNFRTILSYGNDGLVPMGEFIVKDVIKDEIPTEFTDKEPPKKSGIIILAKIDDESVQIVLPMETFLTDFVSVAKRNAQLLAGSKFFNSSLESAERKAKERVLEDKTLERLVNAETMSLDKNEASYLINGEIQSSNYSICPVELGIYITNEKERTWDEDDKSYSKTPGFNSIYGYKKHNRQNRQQEVELGK